LEGVKRSGGICFVPDDEGEYCLASEVCKPEIREGDLIEAKNSQGTVIRGRVVTSGLSGIPDGDGEVCVSFQGLRGAGHRYPSIYLYLDASKVTVLERADGSKP
jgi:hypothetical protein